MTFSLILHSLYVFNFEVWCQRLRRYIRHLVHFRMTENNDGWQGWQLSQKLEIELLHNCVLTHLETLPCPNLNEISEKLQTPCFGKLCCAFCNTNFWIGVTHLFSKNSSFSPLKITAKIRSKISWIRNDPPPCGSFQKFNQILARRRP